MSVRITCINKDGGYHENPHEGITHYGWVNESTNEVGKNDRASMVSWVKSGGQAYVKNRYGQAVDCYVRRSVAGNEFLQTEANGTSTDNLLELPECR